ncbi:MAG: fasciclin domain-containing protein, partial [Deinococcota bacterium]|nr:fasciclin domain-containing protein [Deinococcota bacterium]
MRQNGSFVLLAFFLITSLAFAQVDQATGTVTNDETQARLRVGHLVFGSPNIDLLVNGEIPVNGSVPQADLFAGYIGGYLYLEPGTYSVAVVPTGKGVDEALIGPLDMSLEAGHRYTLAMMGQPEDESLTPLVLDETAILQGSRTDPSQFTLILVNNVAGTTTISFDDERGGPRNVEYGGFGVASYANGDGRECGDFIITFDDTEVVNEPKSGECEPVEPGMDFLVAMVGRFPGEDFTATQSPNSSDLNTLAFLQGFSGVGYEQDGHEFSFDTFLAAVETAGLTELLETGSPYVVFAPTDEAFAALPKDQSDALMADPEGLANLVRYHVAEGYYPRGGLTGEEG